jgi:16S rRNA G1207 methylase RsmC
MKYIRKTSAEVASKMIKELKIGFRNPTILEPSAGEGDICDQISYAYPESQLDCIELNKEKRERLIEKGYNVVGEDFFLFEIEKKYDIIIASPPFQGNVDLKHIEKMYTHLSDRGQIVSLISPHFLVNNEKHQVEFREWLSDKNYHLTLLPDNSFMEKKKTVPTCIIKIYK